MSFPIPQSIVYETTGESLRYQRQRNRDVGSKDLDKTFLVNLGELTPEDLAEIRKIAEAKNAARFLKTLDAVTSAPEEDVQVPNFDAFEGMLSAHLIAHRLNGWIFHLHEDGVFYPYAVTDVKRVEPSSSARVDERPVVQITGMAWGRFDHTERSPLQRMEKRWTFSPGDVARRRVRDILKSEKLFLETDELITEHMLRQKRYEDSIRGGFTKQFRITGPIESWTGAYNLTPLTQPVGHRVIHDLDETRLKDAPTEVESRLGAHRREKHTTPLPRHTLVHCFDLETHVFFWANAANLETYTYDKSLRDKLVLPESHRDLLDVLTSDVDLFTDDMIEGKTNANMILCCGAPGVGKTLTAQCYAELIDKPLYTIQAGHLGTNVKDVASGLDTVFARSERWGCVLLLDEADVFVARRDQDINRNAIVSEFLRAIEKTRSLLFMTTNRPDDIDDAIISRCAAMISYEPPAPAAARKIWNILAAHYGV